MYHIALGLGQGLNKHSTQTRTSAKAKQSSSRIGWHKQGDVMGLIISVIKHYKIRADSELLEEEFFTFLQGLHKEGNLINFIGILL